MPTTSSQFASAIASGTDWRDTSKAVLEELDSIKTKNKNFNFGVLYVSDHLADDLSSILNLFRSVLDIEQWVGGIGMGICGNGVEYIDQPAISALVGYINEDDFCLIPTIDQDDKELPEELKKFIDQKDPMLNLIHADPMMSGHLENTVRLLDIKTNGF